MWILLEEDECNMAEFVDVPKILGDIFESVVGAIYLDTGKDLAKVWEIVYGLMYKEISECDNQFDIKQKSCICFRKLIDCSGFREFRLVVII